MSDVFKRMIKEIKQNPILSGILFIEILFILYYNLVEHRYHLGYDQSCAYLQAVEIWRQKKIILDNWIGQTVLALDSPLLLAALLYGVTNDIFLAFGISNIICIVIFIIILYKIICQLNLSVSAKLLFFCVLLMPYESLIDTANNMGYFSVMYFNYATYLVKVGIIFFVFYVYSLIIAQKLTPKIVLMILLGFILVFFSGISSGYFVLIFGIVPLALNYIVSGLLENHWDKNKLIAGALLVGCGIMAIFGKLVASRYLGFESLDSESVWVSLTQFWDNLGSILQGYFSLTGALPYYDNTPILDIWGVGFGFRLVLAIGILLGTFIVIKQLFTNIRSGKRINKVVMQASMMVLGNLLVFTLCYTKYGSPIFEYRYLIVSFISMLMLFSVWVDKKVFSSNNFSWQMVANFGIVTCIVATNVYSYNYLNKSRLDTNIQNIIISEADKTGSDLVYMLGNEVNILGRNMRVIDLTRIYKAMDDITKPHHWGDYTYYEDPGEYNGSTLLVCTQDAYNALPEYYKDQFHLDRNIDNTSLVIYICEKNPIDLSSGISGDHSIEYFYDNGIYTHNTGTFENGAYIVQGENRYETWGPYVNAPNEGQYEFILHYDIESNIVDNTNVGLFDICVDSEQVGAVDLRSGIDNVSVVVDFSQIEGERKLLEYRVAVNENVTVKLNSIEINQIQ